MRSRSSPRMKRPSRSSAPRTSASFRRKRMPTKEQILDALKAVKFPGLSRDIVSFGFVHDVSVEGGSVSFTVRFQTENQNAAAQISRDAEAAVRKVSGVESVRMTVDVGSRQAAGPQGGAPAEQILSGVKYKIAVAS